MITVESGYTLTIDAGVEVLFCVDGKLVIEPNAVLDLYGTLSSCDHEWKGVEVQGNGATHQFIQGGAYAQGKIECHKGSKIENALIAVKLYGPTYVDAGGKIYADGASFINNSRGVDFARYNNYSYGGNPRDYHSSINNCIFDITEEYSVTKPFNEHIKDVQIRTGMLLTNNNH